jgi:hypothetical protein
MQLLNQFCAALETNLKLIPLELLDTVLIKNLTEKMNTQKSTSYK